MMTNRKNLFSTVLAVLMTLLTVSVGRAAGTAIDTTATFTISKLGDLTLVVREGVPKAIVARGRELSATGIGFSVDQAPYTGDVLLTSNLTLQPGTMPLMFDHDGVIEFTVGADMFALMYNGTATKTQDMVAQTKTLNSSGDFVIKGGTGPFAALNGMKGTYMLTLTCHTVAGQHPQVGDPVEVAFSATGM